MNVSRYSLAALIWGTYIALHFTGGLQSTNGSMEGNPYSLALIIIAACIIFSWPRPQSLIVLGVPVGRFRRHVAATIDLLCLGFVLFAVDFTLAYLMEWIATGYWQWSWQRETYEPRDIIGILPIFLAFYGVY